MSIKKIGAFDYQKKLVTDFRKKMESNDDYDSAALYTILFSMVLDNGLEEVKLVLADLEKDLTDNGLNLDSSTDENIKILNNKLK